MESGAQTNDPLRLNFLKISSRLGRIKHLGLFSAWLAFILCGAYIPELFPQYPAATQTITFSFLWLGLANILLIGIKRLNDFNFRGVWILFCLIPFIGFFWYLTIFITPGSKAENRYGLKTPEVSLKESLLILSTPISLLLIYFL